MPTTSECHKTEQCAVVQCSTLPVSWQDVQKQFVVKFNLGGDFDTSFVIGPIILIVHLLAVFPDYGGNDPSCYFMVLPKREWSRYFGSRIQM